MMFPVEDIPPVDSPSSSFNRKSRMSFANFIQNLFDFILRHYFKPVSNTVLYLNVLLVPVHTYCMVGGHNSVSNHRGQFLVCVHLRAYRVNLIKSHSWISK